MTRDEPLGPALAWDPWPLGPELSLPRTLGGWRGPWAEASAQVPPPRFPSLKSHLRAILVSPEAPHPSLEAFLGEATI